VGADEKPIDAAPCLLYLFSHPVVEGVDLLARDQPPPHRGLIGHDQDLAPEILCQKPQGVSGAGQEAELCSRQDVLVAGRVDVDGAVSVEKDCGVFCHGCIQGRAAMRLVS
jgi:hypothetical protein